jgi:hypothetical protein
MDYIDLAPLSVMLRTSVSQNESPAASGQDSNAATISLTHKIVTRYLFFKQDKAASDEY